VGHARRRQHEVGGAAHHRVGALQGRAGRQLGRDDQNAAINLRDEALRGAAKFIEAERQNRHIGHQHEDGEPHDALGEQGITARDRREAPVE
jgi:hypothetical protein